MFRARYHPSSGVTELYTFRYGNGSQRSPKRHPRRHLFGLLWEPLTYLNVYSSVTPHDG